MTTSGFGAEDDLSFQQHWKNKELPLLKERLQEEPRGEDQELKLSWRFILDTK